eukprot:CAMPEP_0194449344 /NCGR_PEP_ID=MMETSP0176-20130528/130090_1 /TAXON_ID=216777 /ORGANISM="Proboscia alata, Strain PI-D3" /LENGTH=181 /DNA_ID=CAMNT_0039276459 /DNA_START=861 /DNA_END=1406 /DNA_ORIENTATION=-
MIRDAGATSMGGEDGTLTLKVLSPTVRTVAVAVVTGVVVYLLGESSRRRLLSYVSHLLSKKLICRVAGKKNERRVIVPRAGGGRRYIVNQFRCRHNTAVGSNHCDPRHRLQTRSDEIRSNVMIRDAGATSMGGEDGTAPRESARLDLTIVSRGTVHKPYRTKFDPNEGEILWNFKDGKRSQ